MAGDGAPETVADGDLPEPVREWLRRIATERGLSEAELLRQLAPGGEAAGGPDPDDLDALAGELDATTERVDAVESSVEDARADFTEKLEDVRSRVVHVAREADAKAPAEHDHPELEGEVDAALAELDALVADLDALDRRVNTGFENFRSVLEYLTESTDELDGKFDRLAEAVLELRGRVRSLARAEAERAAVADLVAEANRNGATTATCDSCDQSVELSLLRSPRCPHCDAGFRGFEPKEGFFGSHTLRTGELPALEGDVVTVDDALADIVEDEATAGPPKDVRDLGEAIDAEREPDAADVDPGNERVSDSRAGTSGNRTGEDDAAEPPAATADGGGLDHEAVEASDRDTATGERADASADGRPLQEVDGVGPAYAERLQDAGIASAEELAAADAADVAVATDVPEGRVERWIDRAGDLADGD